MDEIKKIEIREADLGPVIARADHLDGAIEVNKKIFWKLPPLVKEFVLCHEACHLKYAEWDEARTNQLAAKLFLDRSKNEDDRKQREEFLSYISTNGGYSNFAWWSLIPAAFNLGYSIYGVVRDQSAGWYSWTDGVKSENLKVMLTTAFEQARRSSTYPASHFFWLQISNYTNKDADLDDFLKRSGNGWVEQWIDEYEEKYGFGFDQKTPIDITAYPLVMVAVGALVAYIVYKIIKNMRK